ncbi:MAG: HNH endonuclease, partial [Pedobacter sp.]
MRSRKSLSTSIKMEVLIESGYRCAVPTCRNILALDIHHIVEVAEGGGDVTTNLIALCPTCHALYHRGTISKEAIYSWKSMLVALSQAFDVQSIDDLLFLNKLDQQELVIGGSGVLKFSRLIAADLAEFSRFETYEGFFHYKVRL